MALTNLIFKEQNLIDTIELDVTLSEGATATATVTKNPVEKGADVTDHIRIEPMKFFTTGVISDTPLIFGGNFVKGWNRLSLENWDKLLKLQASKKLFTLQQNLKSYSNVAIVSLDVTQDSNTSNALIFTCNMEEIIQVGTEILAVNKFNEQAVADQAVSTITNGLKDLKAI